MNGFQLTFFTQQDRRIHGKPVADWLVQLCRTMGIRGATVIAGTEGLGHSGRLHSAHFFELADQPVEVTMVVNPAESDQLFARLRAEKLHIFYVKVPVEFGTLGEPE